MERLLHSVCYAAAFCNPEQIYRQSVMSSTFIKYFKFNPMYYIVQGYRDSMIYHVWFYNNIKQTMYFWIVTILLLIVGAVIYRKLKPHFADVL